MRNSPNPEQRRRTLCDVAIRLLAEGGLKSATHLKVDRAAGYPDGTTSFYFRTSSALLSAVAERVAELDLKDLRAATRDPGDATRASGLATLVIRCGSGVRLVRTKARNELALQAARDPALAEALRGYTDEFSALIRDVVIRLQPRRRRADPALVEAQTYAVTMFIGGVMLSVATGHRAPHTAAELDVLISGMVRGLSAGS
ncbi:TetR/AcrR family transcriptional regulator [Mycobacterium sp. AMU20-3851]|uniref:TetR/AcrR family transcriptional regulator n=1 Tax=Mycobacterium sp. AMU20-3851 TaxID=3122055 RepID=UPI0037547B6A